MAKPDSAVLDGPLAAVALKSLYGLGGLIGLSIGILNPTISILLEQRGHNGMLIGSNASILFVCVALLAPLVSRQLQQVGLRRTMAVGLGAYALAALVFPWLDDVALGFVLRGLMGIGMACTMVSSQTGLSSFADHRHRALANGIYGLCFGIGLAVGPILGSYLYGFGASMPFAACAVLLLQGVTLTLIGLPSKHLLTANRPRLDLLGTTLIPLLSVLAYGFAEATLLSMYPLYLIHNGLSPADIAERLAAFVVGGLIGTLPVCYFGDRLGHKKMLMVCAMAGILAISAITEGRYLNPLANAYLVPLNIPGNPSPQALADFAAAFASGFSLGPIFGLALALLSGVVAKADLPSGSALFTAAFSIGSAAAPFLAAWFMQRFGDEYLFVPTLLIFGLLIVIQSALYLSRLLSTKWGSYVTRSG